MKSLFDPQHEIGRALTRFRPAFVQAAWFSMVINLIVLVPSLYMLQVYDRVLVSRNTMTLLMLTLIVLVLYILMGFLEWMRSRVLIRIGTGIDDDLSERIFTAAFQRHLCRLGGNPAQAMQDLSSTRQFLAGNGALAFFDAPWIPIYLVVITMLNPWLGLFSLCAAVLICLLAWLNELLTHKPITEANTQAQGAYLFANNNLRNGEAIEAMGMLPALRARWAAQQQKVLTMQVLASERGGAVTAISKASRIASQSLILGLGAWLVIGDEMTAGGMVVASILMGRALAPVEQLIGAWKQWIGVQAAYARLQDLMQKFPPREPGIQLPSPEGTISLENVSAIPPGSETPVLHKLALRINAGDIVGVIGPSAAGKSSLARLLVGVWPTSDGHVRLDGADVFPWDKADLGRHVGYLPQDIGLCEGTVAENIARFGELDSERVVSAAQMAGVHELVLRLPDAYNTAIGADGGSLSGGQRQRIALARALYGEPRLVVLDEPNAHLDEMGEFALLQAIAAIKARGATVVFISHGHRLLGIADKLLALRDGALLAYGPRDQVLTHLKSLATQAAAASKEGSAQ
ncbi:MAG: type I secretion system permease/ATPase [Pseudomonadota bacterium]